jgi:outer membrane protein assembly factor BamB
MGPSISTPIFVGNKIIAPGYDGLFLYTIKNDKSFELSAQFDATFESTPVVHNRKVYIASRNGYFYCLGD